MLENIQANWNQTDTTKDDYIQNKPSIPTVNDATITLTQGGVTKGSFTTNQGTVATIALDAGGGGGYDETDYLCFTAGQDDSTVRLDKSGSPDAISLEYSTDKQTWTEYTWTDSTGATITLENIGDKVWFRGDNSTFTINVQNFYKFVMSGTIYSSGNIMSLLDKLCISTTLPQCCFMGLFLNCASLVTAPGMPSETLSYRCFSSMFVGCTSLLSVKLPATTLADECYAVMFQNCTSLKTIEYSASSWITNAYWLHNASATGTFICNSSLDTSTRDTSHVPSGWTIVYDTIDEDKFDNKQNVALDVETSTASTLEISPSGEIAKQVTVDSALTLSASATSSTKIAYTELILDIASGATVTAGTGITFVDTPTVGKRNICVVRWSDGAAKLYVVDQEDLA